MTKKGAAALREEIKYLKRGRLADAIIRVVTELIRWGGLVSIFFFMYKIVDSLSGRTTAANIGIKILGDVRVSEAAAWIFGAGGILYGNRQNKLRKDNVEKMQGRIISFEQRLDPNRTSSNLTKRGETKPEDRL